MHYHIVGIAGAGMSAIAHLLLDQGHTVSGSDLTANSLTADLAARGARVAIGHAATHIAGAAALLATAAVSPDHPELAAARVAGMPILKRHDLWAAWSEQRPVIAVAGTHGKTTTTAMIAWVLTQAGQQPGFLIGSVAPNLGTNARWGDPHAPLVIEADEYDRAFLALRPQIAVITNVEWDHPDIYPTADAYQQAFADFARKTQQAIVTCGDTGPASWLAVAQADDIPLIRYGLDAGNDYQALVGEAREAKTTMFRIKHPKALPSLVHRNREVARGSTHYELRLPGNHNVRNALAAIVVADILGGDRQGVAAALQEFCGTDRRFEHKGEAGGITIIDDYAHHPTEVRATLAAARSHYGQRRIVAYVQPHTYSRTVALLEQWPEAFAAADVVLIGAIYASREKDTQGLYTHLATDLVERIAVRHPSVTYVGNIAAATAAALQCLRPGDVLLTMGAGDGNLIGEAVLKKLQMER